MATPDNNHLNWPLTALVVIAYSAFVAALAFVPRHYPELLLDGGRMTFAMGAALAFVAALVLLTAGYLFHNRAGAENTQSAPLPEQHV